MPRPRGPRRGQGRMFFLESSVLVLLHREAGHGYSLMVGLQEFGFQAADFDISTLYRVLRHLEDEGMVSSVWDEVSLGPQRRVYSITMRGEASLSGSIEELRKRRQEILVLEAAYDAVKKN